VVVGAVFVLRRRKQTAATRELEEVA